jgi:hemolysin III
MLNKLREPFSGLSHLAAAIISFIGLFFLLMFDNDIVKEIALLIYGLSLVVMFSSSAAYHLIKSKPHITAYLRKLDHSAIFLLIAGTYTPICLHFFSGFWKTGLLTISWSIAIVGISLKLWTTNTPRWISTGLYLFMGWISLAALKQIFSSMPAAALVWFFLGGFFFTTGAIIYGLKKPDLFPGTFGFHEIWHIFVILGCFSHYILIAAFIAYPA